MNAKCGLGSFSTARRFFQLWVESQKEPEIQPNPIVDVGRPVSRVEINAKNAPLTPASPHRRLLTHCLRPRAVKNALTRPTQSYTANPLYSQVVVNHWIGAGERHVVLFFSPVLLSSAWASLFIFADPSVVPLRTAGFSTTSYGN